MPGAPKGNQNARTHGFYSDQRTHEAPTVPPDIDSIIVDLYARQCDISAYLVAALEDTETALDKLIPTFALHAQTASRLGRLLRDRRALSNEAADGITGALAQALQELSTELGVKLT